MNIIEFLQVRRALNEIHGPLEPVSIFLRLEIDRMTRVIAAVRSDLLDLRLAIDGIIVMNDALSSALDAIFQAKVPPLWAKVGFETNLRYYLLFNGKNIFYFSIHLRETSN